MSRLVFPGGSSLKAKVTDSNPRGARGRERQEGDRCAVSASKFLPVLEFGVGYDVVYEDVRLLS